MCVWLLTLCFCRASLTLTLAASCSWFCLMACSALPSWWSNFSSGITNSSFSSLMGAAAVTACKTQWTPMFLPKLHNTVLLLLLSSLLSSSSTSLTLLVLFFLFFQLFLCLLLMLLLLLSTYYHHYCCCCYHHHHYYYHNHCTFIITITIIMIIITIITIIIIVIIVKLLFLQGTIQRTPLFYSSKAAHWQGTLLFLPQ